MPSPHNSPNLQAAKDKNKLDAVKYYLQGYSQSQVAAKLGVTRPAVCTYLKEAREEWKNDRLESMDELVDMELAKLAQMEQDSTRLFEKFFDQDAEEGDEKYLNSKEAAEWVKNRLKILEMIHKILGLYKPIKIESKNEINIGDSEEIRSVLLSRLTPKNE